MNKLKNMNERNFSFRLPIKFERKRYLPTNVTDQMSSIKGNRSFMIKSRFNRVIYYVVNMMVNYLIFFFF
jgi:hypothetical protein